MPVSNRNGHVKLTNMKKAAILFLVGFVVTVLIDLTFPFIDLRLTSIVAGLFSYIAGLFFANSKWGKTPFKIALLFLPTFCFVIFMSWANPENIRLLSPLITIAALLGFTLAIMVQKWKLIIGIVYSLIVFLFAFFVIPIIDLNLYVESLSIKMKNEVLLNQDSTIVNQDSLKNKIAVFDFWNTGCGVCRHVHPFMDSLAKTYSGRTGIVFYGVNTGTDTFAKARDFWVKKAYTNTMLYDQGGKLRTALGITAVPVIAIKDKNNVIRWKHEGYVAGERELLINAIKEEISELEKER